MYVLQVKVQIDYKTKEWRDVRPTDGPPYVWKTKEEAESMRQMCYGDCPAEDSRVVPA